MVTVDSGIENGGKVGVGDEEGMQCSEHPFRSNPGGICALCLQEKLGKLVSSSLPLPLPLPLPLAPSPSPSPSLRSDNASLPKPSSTRIPFLSAGKKRGGFWSFLHPKAAPPPSDYSFERKVSRSRSVGCGSRSFSGDFFDRISTGFGDCTLRRVESQRPAVKERVKCGGIFGGFVMTSSSSSSSYWLSEVNAKGPRSRSWGWALASPITAFSGKRDRGIAAAPNLPPIPSLLAARP